MKKPCPDIFRHILMFAAIFIAFLVWFHGLDPSYPQARGGVLDLTKWDLKSNGRISLSGEWEFNWGEFLTCEDYKNNNHSGSIYAYVPQIWNRYQVDGKNLPGFGYATYHLKVKVPETRTILGIRVNTVSTAYRLFINDR